MNESNNPPVTRRSWHYILLWVIALASLALNVYLVVSFNDFQRNVREEASRI